MVDLASPDHALHPNITTCGRVLERDSRQPELDRDELAPTDLCERQVWMSDGELVCDDERARS